MPFKRVAAASYSGASRLQWPHLKKQYGGGKKEGGGGDTSALNSSRPKTNSLREI